MPPTFIILAVTTLLFFALYGIRWLQVQHTINRSKHTTPLETHPLATVWLRKANLLISQSVFLPVLIRVYLLGMIETLVTVIWKRGLLGAPNVKDTERAIDRLLVHQNGRVNRTAIVTGADSGIGFEIARGLLKGGFHVVIASRSLDIGNAAKLRLEELTGSSRISLFKMDLCSFDNVRRFVDQMKSTFAEGEIDVLINNAGVMNIPYTTTTDGYEAQCQTNALSPLLLTVSLLPLMNQDHGHILFAASSTLYAAPHLDLRWTRSTYSWSGLEHYAYSKMYVAQLARLLGQKLANESSRIKVDCYHPGAVRTNLFAHSTVFNLSVTRRFFDHVMLTPKEGSGTALFLVMKHLIDDSNTLQCENGRYWADGQVQPIPHNVTIQLPPSSTANASITSDMDHLWTVSLKQIGLTPNEVESTIQSTIQTSL